VKFKVDVEFDAAVMKSIESSTKVNPNNYFSAAVYYLENGKDLNKALEWINISLQSNPKAFWILHQKAKIQKALNDKKGAIETANASLNSAKEANNRDYQKMNEDLIKSIK
jgi:tetratricopeptide (TPR) repeat protein